MTIKGLSTFCLLMLLFGGCTFQPSRDPKVRITNETDKSEPTVQLSLAAADLSSACLPGYSLGGSFRSGEANCFVLRFAGSQGSVSSIEGRYRYSETAAPLELVCFTNNIAVLALRQSIVLKNSPNAVANRGFMKFGKYKVEIQYQAGGKSHPCRFYVSYFPHRVPELHGMWEGLGEH